MKTGGQDYIMLPEWVGGVVNICHYGWVGLLIYGGGVVTGWVRLIWVGGIVIISLWVGGVVKYVTGWVRC